MFLTEDTNKNVVYSVECSGHHNEQFIDSNSAVTGIHARFYVEVDDMINNGLKPSAICAKLSRKYPGDEFLHILPTNKKITNRRANLKKSDGFVINTVRGLQEFVQDNVIDSFTEFEQIENIHELLVLDSFEVPFDENGVRDTAQGLIFSSKAILNIIYTRCATRRLRLRLRWHLEIAFKWLVSTNYLCPSYRICKPKEAKL
jgi:hypothetical protein